MKKMPGGQWDWIAAGLLFFMLQVAAARLVATEWAPNLPWTESLAGIGTILGLALGVSRFRPAVVFILALGYSTTILPWQLTAAAPDALLADRLNRLGWILWLSMNQFMSRLPVKDTLFFVSLVCLAYWIIGVAAGYALTRHGKVVGAVVAGGAAILIEQAYGNYQPRGSWWLALFLLTAVLLVGRMHFLQQRAGWTKQRIFVGEDSGTSILSGLFMTAALVIMLAWWIPSAPGTVERVTELWNTQIEPLRERLSNAVTSLQGPYGRPGRNFYGNSMPLGQNAAEGDAEVLTVTVLESPGINARYYWRGRSYNLYDGGLWSASTNARLLVHPDQGDLQIPDREKRSEAVFEVSSEFSVQSLIYAPSPAVWIDRSADVAAMHIAPNTYDVFSWESRTTLASGATYQVRALLRNPSVAEMRAAGDDYPEWLSGQYVAIPERHSEQLRALAEQITEGEATPYDKAVAITDYLRRTIEYSPTVPAPPEGQDPVLWVLFEHRKGFCNYAASAEVLLLRAVGIPARLAVGFARGELEGGVYTVYRRDAHAWPEAYFPGIGWVEFEPTGNQAPLIRPTGAALNDEEKLGQQPAGIPREEVNQIPEDVELAPPATPLPFRLTPIGRLLFAVLPFAAAAVAITLAVRLRVLNRMPGFMLRSLDASGGAPNWIRSWAAWNALQPVEQAFAVIRWTLRLLGKSLPQNATPAIQAQALRRALPSVREHIDALREEVETGLFTPIRPDIGRARRAATIVLAGGIRARTRQIIARINGAAVYSSDE